MKIFTKYIPLFIAGVILVVEAILRFLVIVILRCIPTGFLKRLQYFYNTNNTLLKENKLTDQAESLSILDTSLLITSKGFEVEEHFVTTPDGFILQMHRIPGNVGKSLTTKSPIFLLHGTMMCDEVFVCREQADDCLALFLAKRGFDVWLGNIRGNKYSYKHEHLNPNDENYWNFSLDEMIKYDVPCMIDYILKNTNAPKISYCGFSQGSALGMALFSSNEYYFNKINVFISLSPAYVTTDFHSPIINAITRSKAHLIFRLFGKKVTTCAILQSCHFWRRLLRPVLFASIIDKCTHILFHWQSSNLCSTEKKQMYAHLYSYSSVKSIIHWFQIIKSRRFQMFDDTLNFYSPFSFNPHVMPSYDISKMPCKVAIFYGGKDSICGIHMLKKKLPKDSIFLHQVPHYEHLDALWAKDCKTQMFQNVVTFL